jgi:hypothetical protein
MRLSAAASEGDKGVGSGQPFAPIEVTRLDRLNFLVPERDGLPALARYATLRLADGATRVTGYTEASRGCRHLCRHCPVVPVYNGQFRAVPAEVVLADVDRQVAAGAQHITFGDPDFFNGPTHALRIVERLAAAHPGLTYDVTIKIEHLLRHRAALPRLRDTGCLFVTSAVESVDDRVLAFLEKGHTRADFVEAVEVCRHVGLDLVPTFVPFHPWTTRDGYGDMLETIASLDLVEHVAPIQLTIRLLIPSGSRMLELDDVQRAIGPFDGRTLAYPWRHADPSIDRLHGDVTSLVGSRLAADRRELFHAIADAAGSNARLSAPATRGIARVDEPWYCCAEPNPDQLRIV